MSASGNCSAIENSRCVEVFIFHALDSLMGPWKLQKGNFLPKLPCFLISITLKCSLGGAGERVASFLASRTGQMLSSVVPGPSHGLSLRTHSCQERKVEAAVMWFDVICSLWLLHIHGLRPGFGPDIIILTRIMDSLFLFVCLFIKV